MLTFIYLFISHTLMFHSMHFVLVDFFPVNLHSSLSLKLRKFLFLKLNEGTLLRVPAAPKQIFPYNMGNSERNPP